MIKKLLKQSKIVALAILLLGAGAAFAQTPVEKYGQLQIKNGKVSDMNGNPVVLRGMSLFWSGWQEGSTFYNENTVKWLRDDWCVDVVRAAIAVEDGNSNYLNNPNQEMNKLKTVIDACIKNGLYVIVDFHSHEANNHIQDAKTFFTEIANEYGDHPNIIYETFNEPIWQSWSGEIKPYHNEMVRTIRAIDPNNIIVCGTRMYSQEVDVAANDPVTGTNIAYTLHYYAGSHSWQLMEKARIAMSRGAAIFVTEYGTTDASGDGGFNAAESQNWWNFLEENHISSANWSIGNKWETSAALKGNVYAQSGWDPNNDLTESGRLVRDYIKSKCNVVITTGSVTLSFAGDQTQYEAGETVEMTAATTVSNGTLSKVEFYSGETLLGTDNSAPYSYSTSELASGGHSITAVSYDAEGNEVATSLVKIITIVGSSDIATTGVTDQFENEEQFFELTGGLTGTSCATAEDAAVAGVFWFEDRFDSTAFKAEATRTGDGTLKYVISQEEGAYQVIGFGFGEYCNGSSKDKYTLDLTENSTINLTVTSPATNTATLDLKFQMKDADGNVLAIKNTFLDETDEDNWYKHEIGFNKNHTTPDYVSLEPGDTENFIYDFHEALTVDSPNNPDFPNDINPDNSAFDYSRVTEVIIVPVNAEDVGSPSWAPEAFTDQEIIFEGLTLGDPSLGENICTTPPAPSTTDLTYCQNSSDVEGLTADGIEAFPYRWYHEETGGVASEFAPIPSTAVEGTETFYVTQIVEEGSSCESPRTPLDVTVVGAPVADASTDMEIISSTSATLLGSGTDVGTWEVVSAPTGVDITFSPSANTEEATANGLTEAGEYTFSYTVEGDALCEPKVSEVTIEVAEPNASLPLSESSVNIYPNPVNDKLHIDLSNVEGIESLKVVDMVGKVIYETENKNVVEVDMADLEKGMYFIHIKSESGNLIKSVVK